MGKRSEGVSIARINAFQAIVVALVGALAGVAGTVGVEYYDHAQERADHAQERAREAEMVKALEAEIDRQAEALQVLTRSPISVLHLTEVEVGREECQGRLLAWYEGERAQWEGDKYLEKEASYDGHFVSKFDRFNIRAACPEDGGTAAVAVSIQPLQGENVWPRIDDLVDGVVNALGEEQR